MSQLNSNQSEELRHERKFLITDYSVAEVEQIIKYNPACFTKIFHPRTVNNIYFDSLAFDSYYSNVEGDMNRTKARIRWYGKLFGQIEDAVLEFKIKKGLLGKKESYKLNSFTLDQNFSKQEFVKAIENPAVPRDIKDLMLSLYPSLLNSYSRKYLLSADKQFRLTIDSEQMFYRISYSGNTFLNKVTVPQNVVLELKYDSKLQEEADQISNAFPFAITKNSKYLQGIERVLF
jgi:SPX domain protein involved in polyphosphate accumulation